MTMQGQDPSDLVRKMASVINARKQGKTIEDAIEEAFELENPPVGAEEQSEQPVPSAPGEAPAGGALPPGMAQQRQRPELQTLLSTLSGSGATGSTSRLSQQRAV